jgi:hypothetical protein
MAGENLISTLDGLYKSVYGDNPPERTVPDHCRLQALVKFQNRGKVGRDYRMAVALGLEHGYTQAAPEAGAFTIDAPIPGSKHYPHLWPLGEPEIILKDFAGHDGTPSLLSSRTQSSAQHESPCCRGSTRVCLHGDERRVRHYCVRPLLRCG